MESSRSIFTPRLPRVFTGSVEAEGSIDHAASREAAIREARAGNGQAPPCSRAAEETEGHHAGSEGDRGDALAISYVHRSRRVRLSRLPECHAVHSFERPEVAVGVARVEQRRRRGQGACRAGSPYKGGRKTRNGAPDRAVFSSDREGSTESAGTAGASELRGELLEQWRLAAEDLPSRIIESEPLRSIDFGEILEASRSARPFDRECVATDRGGV